MDEDEEDDDSMPILSGESNVPGVVPPKDLYARAKALLVQHGISSYAQCAHATCWLSVPAADVEAALRVLAADPVLAPFSFRPEGELGEGMDARVLRSRTRSVAERAGAVLRKHGIEPMVEDHDAIFEVWVETARHREAAMKVLRADPALLPYVAKSKYARDQELRPGIAPARK